MGLQTAYAGVRGGIWNVLINRKDIHDPAYVDAMQSRCGRIADEAKALLARGCEEGEGRLARLLAR